MNFLKSLFGNKTESAADKRQETEQKNFETLKYDGVRALKINEVEHAIRCFTHALELNDDLEVRDYLSQAYIRHGDLPEAYQQLVKLSETHPDNIQIYLRMADVAYMMEDYAAMADSCEKALLADSENPQVLFYAAKASIGQGDPTNAIAMLTKTIMLKEDAYEAYQLRGETLLGQGDLAAADEDAGYLLDHLEDSEDALMLKARIEQRKGNETEAIAYYNKVLDVNPFFMAAFAERGPLRIAAGDEEGGNEDVQTAAEMQAQLDAIRTEDIDNEGVEKMVKQVYKNNDPYGVFG